MGTTKITPEIAFKFIISDAKIDCKRVGTKSTFVTAWAQMLVKWGEWYTFVAKIFQKLNTF